MTGLHVVTRARIHSGKLEEFRQSATAAVALVQEKDPGTLRYDWFMSADDTECIVLEDYTDAEALLAHLANLGPTLGLFFALADVDVEVLETV